MSIPVTPPHVSINRVKIVDLPGLAIDEEVRGQTAYHLLSNLAVARYAREQAGALNLPAAYTTDTTQTRLELPRFVDDCLSSPDAKALAAARSIGRRLGRNLGHILLALHRGDTVNRETRPDWTAEDWERWGKIERVWLGGGLMSGQLGGLIVHHARAFLAGAGYEGQPQVALTPYCKEIAILGAGRYLPPYPATCQALCFDFGHTSIKRACLSLEDGLIARLHHYAPLAVEWEIHNAPISPDPHIGRQVLDLVTNTITQTLAVGRRSVTEAAVGRRSVTEAQSFEPYPLSPNLMLSVAAYVQGGRLLGNGLYATLSTLADDVRPLLAEAIKAQTGHSFRVHLIHDGTAACAFHAGEPNTAVLLIGTAIGVGFPPADERGLQPLSPTLAFSGAI